MGHRCGFGTGRPEHVRRPHAQNEGVADVGESNCWFNTHRIAGRNRIRENGIEVMLLGVPA
jgi:hypothetical protein